MSSDPFSYVSNTGSAYGTVSREALIQNMKDELQFGAKYAFWTKNFNYTSGVFQTLCADVANEFGKLDNGIEEAVNAASTEITGIATLPIAQQYELIKSYAIPLLKAREQVALARFPDLSLYVHNNLGIGGGTGGGKVAPKAEAPKAEAPKG